jgi:hypothetical protein
VKHRGNGGLALKTLIAGHQEFLKKHRRKEEACLEGEVVRSDE